MLKGASTLVSAASLLLLAVACGGSGSAPQPEPPQPAPLFLSPAAATVKVGGQVSFQALDGQGRPVEAGFRILSGQGASVDAKGRFRAGPSPGAFRIQATALADPRSSAEAAVTAEGYLHQLDSTGDLQVPRTGHSASLLPDGGVLVVGGRATAQAERYSPQSGAFSFTAALDQARWFHSATPLKSGAVLIAGGEVGQATLDHAVLYEGAAFAPTAGSMTLARRRHRASALADGRVLLSGGLPESALEVEATDSAEIFDPTTRRFSATGRMLVPRVDHTATTLADGRVLVVGGRNSTCLVNCPLRVWASAELYDPATGTFTPTGGLSLSRFDHSATLLMDGRVLVAGGTSPDLPLTDLVDLVEIYDPATGTFSVAGHALRRRTQHQATLLGDGTVLLSGGRTEGEGTLASQTVEAFDPVARSSRLTSSDRTTRYMHAAVLLANGEVLLIGGSEGGAPLHSTERFH